MVQNFEKIITLTGEALRETLRPINAAPQMIAITFLKAMRFPKKYRILTKDHAGNVIIETAFDLHVGGEFEESYSHHQIALAIRLHTFEITTQPVDMWEKYTLLLEQAVGIPDQTESRT